MNIHLRLAAAADLPRINDIYNHYVLHSTCTYQEACETLSERRAWFESHDVMHPVIVAEVGRAVVGWGSLSTFHPRSAYRFTVENSVYVDHDWQRKGVGGAILADLLMRADATGFTAIIAGIDAEQTASVALHAKHGFEQVGLLKRVGYKFDRWLDVIYMQRTLPPKGT